VRQLGGRNESTRTQLELSIKEACERAEREELVYDKHVRAIGNLLPQIFGLHTAIHDAQGDLFPLEERTREADEMRRQNHEAAERELSRIQDQRRQICRMEGEMQRIEQAIVARARGARAVQEAIRQRERERQWERETFEMVGSARKSVDRHANAVASWTSIRQEHRPPRYQDKHTISMV
jgi:chromosome segregation ATPase